MRLPRAFAAMSIAAATLTPGCAAPTEPVLSDAVALQMKAMSAEVTRYLYTGIDDRRRLYIKDEETWKALWNEVTAHVGPRPEVPVIDFGNEAVVVVSMGTRSTGGFSINVESVSESESDGALYVEVLEVSPGRGCVVIQSVTAPVHAVRVPLRNGNVQFIERASTRDC